MTSDTTPGTAYDLAVVGAGPAGLAATAVALLGGLTVALVDSGQELGGQYWRHPPRGSAVDRGEDLHHDLTTYERLTKTVQDGVQQGRCRLLPLHQAWTVSRLGGPTAGPDVPEELSLHLVDRAAGPGRERTLRVTASRMLLATGAYDRPLPFPGWDLPGVYTAGGIQALLKGSGVLAGNRVVVGGTGPFLLPVATGLAVRGASVVVCEANDPRRWASGAAAALALPGKLAEGLGYAAALARRRVPVYLRHAVTAAHGTDRVEAVTLSRLDARGVVVPGTQRLVEADAVGTGWGFVPQLDLAVTLGAELIRSWDGNQVVAVDAWQRTSVPGLSAAGEVCGIGGAELALREGQLAAEGVLRGLGRPAVTDGRALDRMRRRIARHRRFAAAMAHAHPVPEGWTSWLDDSVLVCRCEEVSAGQVRQAVRDGATGVRQVKQLTRAGMGWCQGRMCAPAVGALAGGDDNEVPERLVVAPLPRGAHAAPHAAGPSLARHT
ncbi:MAG: NAD(P)/FAD-dependent oxidoreductase [Ornithinimicrobium sp.]|uniref:NAD(P)/FAD-dependent oxidoreductase n=1 Tax=Ornithinimicrobium sp. TaxID=1977084 RepID=UPI0026DF3C95|nr:NAD(P)/FAD-dependent oxidoreductase [Ornithinimicrobium sp.]MDO5739785.1 NAD(P)/FAD-dependent oxidoreductase [Ornithinimicrobium sp.]